MLYLQERSCFIIGIAQAESIICNDMDIQHKDISGFSISNDPFSSCMFYVAEFDIDLHKQCMLSSLILGWYQWFWQSSGNIHEDFFNRYSRWQQNKRCSMWMCRFVYCLAHCTSYFNFMKVFGGTFTADFTSFILFQCICTTRNTYKFRISFTDIGILLELSKNQHLCWNCQNLAAKSWHCSFLANFQHQSSGMILESKYLNKLIQMFKNNQPKQNTKNFICKILYYSFASHFLNATNKRYIDHS